MTQVSILLMRAESRSNRRSTRPLRFKRISLSRVVQGEKRDGLMIKQGIRKNLAAHIMYIYNIIREVLSINVKIGLQGGGASPLLFLSKFCPRAFSFTLPHLTSSDFDNLRKQLGMRGLF